MFTKSCERALAAIPADLICEGGALHQLRICLDFLTTRDLFTHLLQMDTCHFFNRIQFVLNSLSPETALSNTADSLMTICRVIADFAYRAADYIDNLEQTPDLASLAAVIFEICSKFKRVSFQTIKKLKPAAMSDLVSEFKKEAAELNQQQLLAILLHMFMNFNRRDKMSKVEMDKCQKPTPFDQVYAVFHSYLVGDKWRLGEHLGHHLERVNYKVALQKAPVCYSLAIHEVGRSRKVKMGKSGEITFSPLKHCRWCGLVDADFVVCKMCQEDEGYRDVNLFCSIECETVALRLQHREEHARHLMVLLQMEK